MDKKEYIKKVLRLFFIYWLCTAFGVYIGQFLPSYLLLPASILGLVLLLITVFLHKNSRLSKVTYYFIALLLGISAFATLQHFITSLGTAKLFSIVLMVVIIFGMLGLFGYKINLDLRKFGTYLFILLLVLIALTLVALLIPGNSVLMLALSGFGLFLFSLYTIYDFNRIANNSNDKNDIHHDAFSLYINLFNMIINALNIANFLD